MTTARSAVGGTTAPAASVSGDAPLDALRSCLLASSRGDEAAFAELYDIVAPRVYGLVLRICATFTSRRRSPRRSSWTSGRRFDLTRGCLCRGS